MTASVMYNHPLTHGSWASTLIWGRNHEIERGENFNGYLAESTLQFTEHNRVWSRVENVDRTNELLLGKQSEPAEFEEEFLARIQAYTIGYDRDFSLIPGLSTALGGQVTFYGKPDFLTPIYGQHPLGAILFIRVQPKANMHMH
jgi:hypothetical protein